MTQQLPEIHIFDTYSSTKQVFTPIQAGHVGMYVCGITVYDSCHIGHARVMCAFDTIVRYLQSVGYQVRLIRNITDIDDKIIHRAMQCNTSIQELTDTFIAKMHHDFNALGLLAPSYEPKATDYITKIISLIEKLIAKGYAYPTNSGDVYYRVAQFSNYGCLSGKNIAQLRTGDRSLHSGEHSNEKEDWLDFALWKHTPQDITQEASWSSPWGFGRPGWHIECSAMSVDTLGKNFDIHAGGPDLIFPHHENEIAQSVAAYDCDYAHYWMHAGALRIGKEKMSKSLGNYLTIHNALNQYPAEVWRYYFAQSHYRSAIHYQPQHIEQASRTVHKLYEKIACYDYTQEALYSHPFARSFAQAMQDDFHTPQALACLQKLVNELIKTADKNTQNALASTTLRLARSIGLLLENPQTYLQNTIKINAMGVSQPHEKAILDAIQKRNIARQKRDFATADAIRNDLFMQGIALEDTSQGTIWHNRPKS